MTNPLAERCVLGFVIQLVVLGVLGLLLLLLLHSTAQAQESVRPDEPNLAVQFFAPLLSTGAAPVAPTGCTLRAEEQAIADAMIAAPDQRRSTLTCVPALVQIARARAQDMARRDYFGHVDPDGLGANYYIRQSGYLLPSYYGVEPSANNVESIAAGYADPGATWAAWMGSSGHRTHILGLQSFFAEQIDYGIGYAIDPDSTYQHYWVIITARTAP